MTPHDFRRRCTESATFFVENVLHYNLWSKQREILDSLSVNERTACKSAHGTGKTLVAACGLVWWLYTRKPSLVFSTAPTDPQVEKLLWKEVNVAYAKLPAELRAMGRCLTKELKLAPDHFAFGRSTDDPENLQGQHSPHLMVIVDEAASVTDDMFKIIDTFAAGGEYRELYIGNPTSPEGRFYRAFQNAEMGYNRISIPAAETPAWTGENVPESVKSQLIQQERVAKWALDWGIDSATYQSRVLAEFPESDATTVLVPLTWLEAAQGREVEYGPEPILQMGLDVARYGDDRTSLCWRKGRVLQRLESRAKLSTQEVAGWCAEEARQLSADNGGAALQVLVDEGGNPGIIDLLLALDIPNVTFEGVAFGSSATDNEKHSNRRNEMMWSIREWFKPDNNEPDTIIAATGDAVERFVAQASSIKYTYDSKARPAVERKDDMKKRGLPSPDELDAVALAFAPRVHSNVWAY